MMKFGKDSLRQLVKILVQVVNFMPLSKCELCSSQPLREVAISRWINDPSDDERLTIEICAKHYQRLNKSGTKGVKQRGYYYRIGFWS